METEFEAKFLDIDIEKLRSLLESSGAKLKQPMRLMRRIVFDDDETAMQYADSFVRVRDEGDKITMTYKNFKKQSVDGTKEIELVIDDFEKARAFLPKLGLFEQSYQESKRETWLLDGVKVEIDEWPWVKPYVEVEGKDEASVRSTAKKLGFDWDKAAFGDVTSVFIAEYDVEPRDVGRHKLISFEEQPPKEWKRK